MSSDPNGRDRAAEYRFYEGQSGGIWQGHDHVVAFAPQRISNMVRYLGAPLGGNLNGRATDRLDRSYHHWWNCGLARRAVHEEPNGAGDEHRARHRWGRCRQLAVRLPRYLVWRLDWLSDCRLHRSLHPNRDRPRIQRRSSAANMKARRPSRRGGGHDITAARGPG